MMKNSRQWVLLGFALLSFTANAQVTLTGATWYATSSKGGTNYNQGVEYGFVNTLGGDFWWNLWLARDPDATSPVNGPSDLESTISIPLSSGNSYKYYVFLNGTCCTTSYSGIDLFFDNNVNPGISAFGPIGGKSFAPDTASTLSLQGNEVPSSGTTFYTANGMIVLLTEYVWNGFEPPPGNVCQEFEFTPNPNGQASSYGSFTVRVFPAATFNINQPNAPPLTKLTATGSGYQPGEKVNIYADQLGSPAIGSATADLSGSVSFTFALPQHVYGSADIFALGSASGNLGASSFRVEPALALTPKSVAPGGNATVYGLGFAADETVDVYFGEPRELIGKGASDTFGGFSLQEIIPANATRGLNNLLGIGETSGAIGLGNVRVK